jgi:glycosyltransferase involved in cell wall biosynthesis
MASTVHHFGPDPSYVGGMGSVLRILTDNCVGGDKVILHSTWRPDSPFANAAMMARSLAEISCFQPESVVHVHLSERGSFVREGMVLAYARRCALPVVATIHGANFLPFAERHPRLALGVLRRADLVTCLDREIEQLLIKQIAPSAVELLPNPVPIDEGAGGADEAPEVVLFAGEIGTRKGADVLFAAWRRVLVERPTARCLVVGPPGDLEIPEMERLEPRQSVDAVVIRELLRSARVVALPSRAEGMPMLLTEALATGRPFVSTPVGGIPELAQAGGMLVPVGEPEPLALALIDLLANPAVARKLGEEGRRFCTATRSTQVIDQRLRVLYQFVRERHPSHATQPTVT